MYIHVHIILHPTKTAGPPAPKTAPVTVIDP